MNEDLPRYIFACDEVAEVLDKTGLSKEQKEQVAQVESRLATIARQGRAFGIHLILATQRPDANILAGQIKITSTVAFADEQITSFLKSSLTVRMHLTASLKRRVGAFCSMTGRYFRRFFLTTRHSKGERHGFRLTYPY